jgi:hypothetical protein
MFEAEEACAECAAAKATKPDLLRLEHVVTGCEHGRSPDHVRHQHRNPLARNPNIALVTK